MIPGDFFATSRWPDSKWTKKPASSPKQSQRNSKNKLRTTIFSTRENNFNTTFSTTQKKQHSYAEQLFAAIIQRDVDKCKLLLENPRLLETRTTYGATPLILACAVGDVSIVAHLLELGANITADDEVGASPLIMAAQRGHAVIVDMLITSKQGGCVGREHLLQHATSKGENAVLAAAKGGHVETLQRLVTYGGDLQSTNYEGVNAVMLAAKKDKVPMLQFLLQNGVSCTAVDAKGRTVLMHAASGGALEATPYILASMSPDIHVRDESGWTALHHAVQGGQLQVVQALTDSGLQLTSNDPAATELLLFACKSGSTDVVRWMLLNNIGSTLLMVDGEHQPMFHAVKHSHFDVIKVLLAQGARLECKDSKGRTPLAYAARNNNLQMIRFLVERGADLLAADTLGRVPRQIAYEAHHHEAAMLLSDLAKNRLLMADDEIALDEYRAMGNDHEWAY